MSSLLADTLHTEDIIALPRAQGSLKVSFKQSGGKTKLDRLYQQGCLKARFPNLEPKALKEGVMINTAGGLTDGDDIYQKIRWGKQTSACMTTQAAERIYLSRQDNATINTKLVVEEEAMAYWLPQETILFDGGRFVRNNQVEVAAGGRLLATESLIFGRSAMNEQVISGHVFDSWRIKYDNQLVFADGFSLSDNMADCLQNKIIAHGAKAIATLIYAGEDAASVEAYLKTQTSGLEYEQTYLGSSLLPKILHIRILSENPEYMRLALMKLISKIMAHIDETHILPRVWLC